MLVTSVEKYNKIRLEISEIKNRMNMVGIYREQYALGEGIIMVERIKVQ